ncbi:hypothetical protein L2748_22960 [Shewanella sairae]|uniref:hypothetical protein n=1 Tax=Shewanella sairae TaxID=190310 RepID=UPI00200D2652|nr:hypothetical protein [Shewanella sairae]MCL1132535.1 hypothetical protein [Shewanella sairae]
MRYLYLVLALSSFNSVATTYPMQEIYDKLDITSFNSSLRPRIDLEVRNNKTHFSDIKGLPKPTITKNKLIFDSDTWTNTLEVIEFNRGEYSVCFTDKAKQGTYNSQSPFVLRRYGDTFVAINDYSEACEEYAR